MYERSDGLHNIITAGIVDEYRVLVYRYVGRPKPKAWEEVIIFAVVGELAAALQVGSANCGYQPQLVCIKGTNGYALSGEKKPPTTVIDSISVRVSDEYALKALIVCWTST